ncbi:hypothetical protein HRJ41_17425 [Pseudomonas sp. BF61]|uniref:hypothetical protein n=1 Tax=Pseudomonas sp. BF61 TaxID=2741068 RepID=UPI001C0D92D0|nr:hypothetical protein [Pseudomonas sp. BF61]MBU4629260.1 hypothetical protein [Pseudomonas sp. BF61]
MIDGSNDAKPKAVVGSARWLDVPALPIIQNAVIVMAPVLDPQRNEWVMQQICALARGDSNQAQVNQALAQEGVDVNKLPLNGSPLSLLVNGDTAQRNTLCAAYLVKTVLLPPILNDFMSPAASVEKHPELAKSAQQIDPARLKRALAIKLAVAKASADIFALIAVELQQTPGLTVGQLSQRSQQLFASLAPSYLKRIRELYAPEDTEYALAELSAQRFAFNSSNGSAFEYSRSGMTLKFNNIIWYGEGQLLGKTYFWRVNYFDSSVVNKLDIYKGAGQKPAQVAK